MEETYYVMADYYGVSEQYVVTQNEVEQAFYITHGYWPNSFHQKEFSQWLNRLLGKTIVKVIPESDMTIELLARSRSVLAVKLYRERTKCTLREAKEYIDELRKKLIREE